MDAQQIKDLIATTIAGQGNQVDSGGKLAEILTAIVDNIPTQVPDPAILPIYIVDEGGVGKEEFAEALGITPEQLDKFMRGDYVGVRDLATARTYLCINNKNLEDEQGVEIINADSDGAWVAYSVYRQGDEYGMGEI